MSPTERLRVAHKTVHDAAPALILGNEPASGYSILTLVAFNGVAKHDPQKARALADALAKEAEQEIDRRAASDVQ